MIDSYKLKDWKVIEEPFLRDLVPRSETLFSLGNGYLGLRGAFEEKREVYHSGSYLNGFYEIIPITYGEWAYGYPQYKQRMLNLPDGTVIKLFVNGEPLDLSRGKIISYRRILDLREGSLERTLKWESPGGKKILLTVKKIVSFTRKNVAAFKWQCKSLDGKVTLKIESGIDLEVRQYRKKYDPRTGSAVSPKPLHIEKQQIDQKTGFLCLRTKASNLVLLCSMSNLLKCSAPFKTETESKSNLLNHIFKAETKGEEEITLYKYLSYGYSRNFMRYTLESDVLGALKEAETAGFDSLLNEQIQFLERFWAKADVQIEGDAFLQECVRFNIFHILQATGYGGKTSIPAKGLTGEGYEGHYFWDAEMYVLPFFLYTHPNTAREILLYRYCILDKARKRAGELHHRGALYPWRTINGDECSGYYPAGTAQYHINADIAYMIRKYVNVSGDTSFLFLCGAEMLFETARFWTSLGDYIPGKGFCLNVVTGPDEYTALVNNNTFTNLMARDNLKYASDVASLLNSEYKRDYTCIAKKIGLKDAEIEDWKQAADEMYIPFDRRLGVFPQDDTFMEKAVWDFASTGDEQYPLLLHFHPLNIYRYQILKQPDVVLVQVLQSRHFSLAEKRRNFDYYDPLTTGDSSLAPAIQCIASVELGYMEKAMEYFIKTTRLDLDDINKNVKDGIHMAAMGGTWLALVYGFGGLRDDGELIKFSPHLPAEWSRICFRLAVKGALLEMDIYPEKVLYTLLSGEDLTFFHEYRKISLRKEQKVELSTRPRLEAVIFDLDGVITDTAECHYKAWKMLAEELEVPFDRKLNQKLRGVGRIESLKLILNRSAKHYSEESIKELADRKNDFYRKLIEQLGPSDLLPGIEKLLKDLRRMGIKTALASASRNAQRVIELLKVKEYFNFIVDANTIVVGKPDPEIFIKAAEALEVPCRNCAGVEDAQVGIEAINRAGMFSIGVGDYLKNAHWKIPHTGKLTAEELLKQFEKKQGARLLNFDKSD